MMRNIQAQNTTTHAMKYGKRDMLTAAVLLVLTLVLGLGILDKGHPWGDDFAGYMLHAKALVEGDVEEMRMRNAVLHPSPRSFDEGVIDESPLCYVWGLPMVLSLVYRLVGYDAPGGEMILYYKIPGAIFFAIFAAALFLFYRRRFSFAMSLFLTFMLCSHESVYGELNDIMTDILCMAASMVSLLCAELFAAQRRPARKATLGIALGIALWYTATVRLNGMTVVLCALLYQALALLAVPKGERRYREEILPWAVFIALYVLTNVCLPAPNSNTSDMASVTLNRIKDNVLYYYGLMESFFGRMLPDWLPGRNAVHLAVYALIALGLLTRGWQRGKIHLAILLCGTGVVLLTLPYRQDVRYMFNVLPLLLLFAGYGMSALIQAAGRFVRSAGIRRMAAYAALALMLVVSCCRVQSLVQWKQDWLAQGGRERLYEAYHPASKDIYAYISENVEEDAVIAYIKPRTLYLNTGRMSLMVGINGHHFYDADYVLTFAGRNDDIGYMIWPELDAELTLVYQNHEYELYRISDAYRSLRYEQE